eukprot:gene1007-17002_t
MRFSNAVAVVTGGSAGIGLATVKELLREGAKVCSTGLPADAGKATAELEGAGFSGRYMELTGNMADDAFCLDVVAKTVEKFGKVDHLVNNAFSFNATGMDSNRDDWTQIMEVGPVAYARMTQAVANDVIKRDAKGSVVNVSSISAHIAQPNRWTYNAAKGAVHQLTKCSALDLGQQGVRVNSANFLATFRTDASASAWPDAALSSVPVFGVRFLTALSARISIGKPWQSHPGM